MKKFVALLALDVMTVYMFFSGYKFLHNLSIFLLMSGYLLTLITYGNLLSNTASKKLIIKDLALIKTSFKRRSYDYITDIMYMVMLAGYSYFFTATLVLITTTVRYSYFGILKEEIKKEEDDQDLQRQMAESGLWDKK